MKLFPQASLRPGHLHLEPASAWTVGDDVDSAFLLASRGVVGSFEPTPGTTRRRDPHRGLVLGTPEGHPPAPTLHQRATDIRRRNMLGGLIHEYSIAA